MKKIKFHSIYYRFILFILAFAILVINMIMADKNGIIQFYNFNIKLRKLNYHWNFYCYYINFFFYWLEILCL